MMAVDGRLDFIEKEMYVHALYYRFFLGQSEEIGLLPGNFRSLWQSIANLRDGIN